MQLIKGGFSFRLESRVPVWQPSFTNHRIRDAEDFARHRDYIPLNPVRAGLVSEPREYLYGSSSVGGFDPAPPGLKPGVLSCA
jgi:putative transposase